MGPPPPIETRNVCLLLGGILISTATVEGIAPAPALAPALAFAPASAASLAPAPALPVAPAFAPALADAPAFASCSCFCSCCCSRSYLCSEGMWSLETLPPNSEQVLKGRHDFVLTQTHRPSPLSQDIRE